MGIGTGLKPCCQVGLSLKYHSVGWHFTKMLDCPRVPLHRTPRANPSFHLLLQFIPKPHSWEQLGRSSGLQPSMPPNPGQGATTDSSKALETCAVLIATSAVA